MDEVSLENSHIYYRIAAKIYLNEQPFGVDFDKLKESGRWPYYGAAEELVNIIEAAVYEVKEKEGKPSDPIERRGGASGAG